MFKIENKQIHITRGDIANIGITVQNEDGTDYEFKKGDIVRFSVFRKRGCNYVELRKDTVVEAAGTEVEINLTEADTKIGEIISKPVEYWYEVELNPDTNPQTVIGYDTDGAKTFTLYPEASDEE
jgi:hypothetical protein